MNIAILEVMFLLQLNVLLPMSKLNKLVYSVDTSHLYKGAIMLHPEAIHFVNYIAVKTSSDIAI